MNIFFTFFKNGQLRIVLKKRGQTITETDLTAGQGFDNMLIRLLDKILLKHKIRRLSFKNVEIQEEIREISASRLIAAAVREAVLTLN